MASILLRVPIQSSRRMAPIWWFCVPVLFATVAMATDLSPEVIDYTTSLIQYLSEQEPGSFDCWFYEHTTSAVSGLSVLDPIVSSEKLALVPKRILHSVGYMEIPRQPSVLVMFCDGYYDAYKLIGGFLHSIGFDYFMKIIVFSESELFVNIKAVFQAELLFQVIYIRTDSLLFGQYLISRNTITERSGFVPFDEVFVDQARDLNGYVVRVSTFMPQSFGSFEMMGKKRIFEWIDDAVRVLNGSYHIYAVTGRTVEETVRGLFKFNGIEFDFSVHQLATFDVNDVNFLISSIPGTFGMLVPRGRKLNVLEIFVAPFTVEVWIVLLVVIVSGSFITTIWPHIFQNDIILLPLCGIERRDLNRTSLLEKITITSLTVLFFLLTSAYESKLISLMTSSPNVPDPCTLDDLIRNNITVQHVSINNTALIHAIQDPKMLQVFRYNPNLGHLHAVIDSKDRHQAYVGDMRQMEFAVNDPKTREPSGRSTFHITDNFTGFTVAHYPIHPRSPLKRQLSRIEKALFEAGILHYLRQIFQFNYGKLKNNLFFDDSANIGITELMPAWYVLGLGLGVSSLMFVMEWIMVRCVRMKRRRSAWAEDRSALEYIRGYISNSVLKNVPRLSSSDSQRD